MQLPVIISADDIPALLEAIDLVVIAIEVVYVASSTNVSVITLVAECEGTQCDRNDS